MTEFSNSKTTNKGSDRNRSKQSRTLYSQFVIWLLLVALLPLTIISIFNYNETTLSLKNEIEQKIFQSAIMKHHSLKEWLERLVTDVKNQSTNINYIRLLEANSEIWNRVNQSPSDFLRAQASLDTSSSLNAINLPTDFSNNFKNWFLVDSELNILHSQIESPAITSNLAVPNVKTDGWSNALNLTLTRGAMLFTGSITSFENSRSTASYIFAPLYDNNQTIVGALAFELQSDTFYKHVVSDFSTGQRFYLTDISGLLLTPFEGNTEDVLKRSIEQPRYKMWFQENGQVFAIDQSEKSNNIRKQVTYSYKALNGEQVLGIHQQIKIANFNAILVNEIDIDVAYSQLYTYQKRLLLLIAMLSVILITISLFAARNMSLPIQRLLALFNKRIKGETTNWQLTGSQQEVNHLQSLIEALFTSSYNTEKALKQSNEEVKYSIRELSEQKYALDQHAIVATTDMRGTITSVNQKFCDISGYSRAELIGKNHRILNSGYHPKQFFREMYLTISSGKVWVDEVCNRAKDGNLYWVATTVVPNLNENGKPKSYIAIREEITQKKEAEIALAKSEAITRNILSSVSEAIMTVNTNGAILEANKASEEIFSYQLESVVGLHITDLMDEALSEKCQRIFTRVNQDKNNKYLNKRINLTGKKSNGDLFPLELSITELSVDTNSYYAVIVKDLTKQRLEARQKQLLLKNADLKLRIAKTLSKNILLSDKLESALNILLSSGVLSQAIKSAIFLNKNEEKNEYLVSKVGDFEKNYDRDRKNCHLVCQNKKISIEDYTDENDLTHENGANENSELTAYYVPIANHAVDLEQILGVLIIHTRRQQDTNIAKLTLLQDIADLFAAAIIQDNARQMLKQASELADQNNQLKSEFLASISHEIRTPMNGVLGMLGLLLNSRLNDDQKHKAMLAQSSAQSLLVLINDILDFSKIEAGKLELEEIDFDVQKLLEEFVQTFALKAQAIGVELVLDACEVTESFVKGDPNRLRQVLTNLVGNAIKFTEKGEIVIRAKLTMQLNGEHVFECSVEDTGIGIPEDKMNAMFKEFTQIDASTTRRYGGTGLGLSICKKICNLMSGDISVKTEVGKGSQFHFHVSVLPSERSKLIVPDDDLNQLNLMVVDDNETARSVISKQLTRWGASVQQATSGKEALKILTENLNFSDTTIDAIFIDTKMPAMNGFTLVEEIKRLEKFASVDLIMMKSLSDENELNLLQNAKISSYFTKPASTFDLFKAISRIFTKDKEVSTTVNYHTLNHTSANDSSTASLANRRVLLVEDNPINQEVVLGILEDAEMTIDIANNGVEATQILSQSSLRKYDLVLMDCQMPEMDGYQTTKNIRSGKTGEYNLKIPIIAMTANAMQGDKEKCLASGMDDYLPKPVEPNVLIQKIKEWLCINQTLEELSQKHAEDVQSSLLPISDQNIEVVWDKAGALKRVMGKEKLLLRLIMLFIEDTPNKVHSLEQAVKESDIAEVKLIAHTVKGVASNINAEQLRAASEKLEKFARDKNTARFKEFVDKIKKSLTLLLVELNQFVSDNQSEQTSSTFDKRKATELFKNLSLKLSQNDYIEQDEIDQFCGQFSQTSCQQYISQLRSQLAHIDNESARDSLEQIAQIAQLGIASSTDKISQSGGTTNW